MKRILLSTDDPGVGGVAQYNHSLLCGLAKIGFEVTSLHASPYHQTYTQLVTQQQELGIKHIGIDYSNLSQDSQNLRLIIRKQLEKIDLLICSNSNPFSNLIIKQIAIEINIPYIIVEGLVEPHLAVQVNHQLDQLFHHYNKARFVIAVSENNLSLLRKLFRLPENKGQVIYYGRPSNYFTPRNVLINENLRRKLKIPLDAVVCLTSARIEKRKGYQYQLQAIEQLRSTPVWNHLYFIWVGGGVFEPEFETELQETVKQLKIKDKVKFLGQQDNVSQLLDVADIFILTSELEGMPLSVMEAMSKGLPVIATAVSGIPEELGNTGQLIADPKHDPKATVRELCDVLQNWAMNAELRQRIGMNCKKRAEKMFKEERMIQETISVIERALLPEKDYVSPGLKIVQPDQYFPNMIVGNPARCSWPYLRGDIPHNWYVDRRQPTIGFLSRDEAQILYNTALKFKHQNALEIGCWMGWSACHLGLAGVKLDVIDPILKNAEIYNSVTSCLRNSGVLNQINLWAGYSPQKVEELANQSQKKWSLIFIDGNHESPGPLQDAIACEKYAEENAMILFHDLASPDVAEGLHYLRDKGWNTMIYQTMQIMGVAWRGNVEPVMHQPDSNVNWQLPTHLMNYRVSDRAIDNSEQEFQEILSIVRPYTLLSYERLFSLYSLAKKVCLEDITGNFVECGVYKGGGSALLATVIKRYTLRPRFVYAFDTFEGMPDPSDADLHQGIPANQTGFGAGTLGAPIRENLDKICQLLDVQSIIKPVPGLFCETLPLYREQIGDIAFLHADGDWYDSTLDIFNNLYDNVVSLGMIQIDDYGHWEGCKKAIHEFEKLKQESFRLHQIDYTGVWFRKGNVLNPSETLEINLMGSSKKQGFSPKSKLFKIIIDGVFFQFNNTGIARVWKALLKEWSTVDFRQQIIVLDRQGTAPKIPGIMYRSIPLYDYGNTDRDRQLLQAICDQEKADLFISTYYTTPISTPSVFMGYDMIPEVIGLNLDEPMWREKHRGILHASGFITISQNTAQDLVKIFPQVTNKPIQVAYSGVDNIFTPATLTEIERFKQQYHLSKPYFIIIGDRISPKGYKNSILLFQALSRLDNFQSYDILCIGGKTQLEKELQGYISDSNIHLLRLNDQELRLAYCGAIALVYPSKYEGFGLPILEAMACGCPVITCRNSSIVEVADNAAIYVNEDDIDQLTQELKNIQNTERRNALIAAGFKQAQKFSWQKMADIVRSTLLEIAENLQGINQKSTSVEEENKATETQPNLTRLSQSSWDFPQISPLNSNLKRPFWSVMIPTFNKVHYLEQTLRSVLEQAPGEDEMQIEVINDCPDSAVQAELEAIVKKVGGNRIKFYRHSQLNIGQTAIFNLCLERAQGQWIHLLHDDDFVLPGFYQTLRNIIEKEPKIGAAFCRHYYVDSENHQRSISTLERETPGILENWIERIAVSQRIQPSSMVVKRSIYEQLGGFCPQAKSAADWEMWTRISAHYPIAYEPQILAAYRLHLSSWTSRLIQGGENITDTLKSIEISQSYLLENQAIDLSNQAKEHYGLYAISTAQQMLTQGDAKAVIAQIQAALNCSQSDIVKQAIIALFAPPKQPKVEIKTLTPAQILAEVFRLTEEYKATPNSNTVINPLRQIRQILAQYWLGLETQNLEKVYLGEIGQAYKILLNSSFKNEALTPQEKAHIQDWCTYLKTGLNQPKGLQYLLALTLYCYPYHLPQDWYIQAPIPKWFLEDYFKFMLAVPQFFQEVGEADRYYRYVENWINYTHGRFMSNPEFPIWKELAWKFTQMANFIPLYFNTANLKEIYIKRGEIMEFALKSLGHALDYEFPQRSNSRQKIRLGILSNHFNPQTETYAILPTFEYLDRNQFEVILYTVTANNHPLEQYCKNRVDQLVPLPSNLTEQVNLIRNHDLDILLIGSNITAVSHPVTLLALHKLARIQVNTTPSCVTSGMGSIDYYISGVLTEPQENAQEQYREKLMLIPGTAHCFSCSVIPPEAPQRIPNRSLLGIPDDFIMFISGSNFYKIIPEVQETWAKILAAVPNSFLVLYPFNPNWSSRYATVPFIKQFQSVLAQYGVESRRLIFLQKQPSRSDIKEYLKLADIYLDSYPFSGVTSLLDPLEVGLVPIVRDGDSIPSYSSETSQAGQIIIPRDGGSFRSLMAASLLRSLSIPDLITNSEAAYINLAITLANNPQLRQQKRQEIQHKMQQNPEFLDSRTYSAKIGVIFQQLFQNWQQNQQFIQANSREGIQQYLSCLVNAVNRYDLERNNESVIDELREIRKLMAQHWLKISPEHLEQTYRMNLGKGYQILLNRGIQREALTPEEQKFLHEITQKAIGLKQSDSLNSLMVLMLYYPPGKILVANADHRLPEWLLKDYKRVFENPSNLETVKLSTALKTAVSVPENQALSETEAFQKRLVGCVNLYRIDPSNVDIVKELRQIRQELANFWLGLESPTLESIYQSSVGQAYRTLLQSGFSQEVLTASEQEFIKTLASKMNQGLNEIDKIKYLLAVLLYCRPGQLQIQNISRLPHWFRSDYQQLSHQVSTLKPHSPD